MPPRWTNEWGTAVSGFTGRTEVRTTNTHFTAPKLQETRLAASRHCYSQSSYRLQAQVANPHHISHQRSSRGSIGYGIRWIKKEKKAGRKTGRNEHSLHEGSHRQFQKRVLRSVLLLPVFKWDVIHSHTFKTVLENTWNYYWVTLLFYHKAKRKWQRWCVQYIKGLTPFTMIFY
jgi:hypothetical protein